MARSPGFYWARLRKASLTEILHRLREKVFVELLRCAASGWSPAVPKVSPEFLAGLRFPEIYTEPGTGTLNPAVPVHGLDSASREKEEVRFREVFFSRIRLDQLGCDLRALWEPARLQDVAADLAGRSSSAFQVERDHCALQRALAWIDSNPFPFGLHYLSVMECGLRIPVFVRCLTLTSGEENSRRKLLSAIYHHAWITAKRLSLYSSLGNHTVAECTGLVFAGGIFIEDAAGKKWFSQGIALLEQELFHQILDDGGPVEQSLGYHRFVLDLYWLCIDFLEQNNLYDCSGWKPKLVAGEAFLAAMSDENGLFPAIGDNDDGRAIAPGLAPRRATCLRPAVTERIQTFPQAGYTVLRDHSGLMLIFDHGPLGMAPLYNHGHADALALTLSIKGKQLLVDSGTYRYNQVPEWRRYFKGTRAHNTVTIDGLDQAEQVTGFIWDKPYTAQLLSSRKTEDGIHLEATHNGYTRLPQPVEHLRSLLWLDEGCILVRDTFIGMGKHTFELNFHLHPEANVAELDGWWHVCRDDAKLALCLLEDANFTYIFGQESPILGWFSSSYGNKEKTGVLQNRKTGISGATTFTTALLFSGEFCKERLYQYAKSL